MARSFSYRTLGKRAGWGVGWEWVWVWEWEWGWEWGVGVGLLRGASHALRGGREGGGAGYTPHPHFTPSHAILNNNHSLIHSSIQSPINPPTHLSGSTALIQGDAPAPCGATPTAAARMQMPSAVATGGLTALPIWLYLGERGEVVCERKLH